MKDFQEERTNGYHETRPDCCLRCRHSLQLEFEDPLECTKVSSDDYLGVEAQWNTKLA